MYLFLSLHFWFCEIRAKLHDLGAANHLHNYFPGGPYCFSYHPIQNTLKKSLT